MSRAGRGRPGGGGRRGRASEMRERADEMAALLDEAAPRAQRTRRRRATAVPAAVAAFGALSIGGVGLALGLTPTGAEGILPASPSPALSDPASSQPTTSADATAGGTPTEGGLDPAVAGADLVRADDHDTPGRTGPAPAADPRGQAAPPPWSTRAGHPTSPRPGPTTTRPRPTSSRPTPTSSRSATPRSTSTRPGARTASATPRPVAQRADLPSSGTPDQERDTTSPTTATSVTRGTGGSTG